MSIQTLVLLMFIACCLVFVANKLIAARIYIRTVEKHEGKKSPYSFSIEQNSKNEWGYCITENGKLLYSNGGYGSAIVYKNLKDLLEQMNLLEKVNGYKITVLDEENK
ncbi:hypothetical protein DQT32_03980 [Salmonella enterica subsp. enterica serovar Braenderup]|nr:hypothetical protein [Salmonella enterica subsp. enterica serovar Braenderup]